MKHALAYLITARVVAAASLVAATYATTMAQSGSAPQILPRAVTLAGTVSVRELSASAANRQTPQMQQNPEPIEGPLPGGVQISPPSKEMLERLPLATEPNAGVGRHIPFRQISGFTGITLGSEAAVGANATPPDQGLAVHDNIVAEIVNRSVQFFKSDGTPLTSPIRSSAFFLAEGLLAAGTQVHDPQAFFDPKSKRWYFHAIIPTVPNMVSGAIGLAVSQSSDPLGTYFIYHIRRISDDLSVCGGVDCFPDYPHGGYDAHALFISTRLFSGCATCFIAAVYVLPKAQLEAGLRENESLTIARFLIPDNFVVQPSIPAPHEPFETANGGIEYLLGAPSSDVVRVFAISNTSEINRSPSSLQLISVDVPTEPFAKSVVPSAQPNIVGPTCASQGVTSAPSLNAATPGDFTDFTATIQKAGGNLYGVLPFGSKDGNGFGRDVLAWFILRPTLTSTPSLTANIVAQGYVVPPDGYSLIYPAFAVNKAGKGLIGFTVSNPDANAPGGFPSAAIIEFAGFPRGNIIVTGQGATSADGGGCSPSQSVGSWGDYGAATVDAATGFFYTANEYIPDPTVFPRIATTNWGTFITQVAPARSAGGPIARLP
jgi:hypothetical protein